MIIALFTAVIGVAASLLGAVVGAVIAGRIAKRQYARQFALGAYSEVISSYYLWASKKDDGYRAQFVAAMNMALLFCSNQTGVILKKLASKVTAGDTDYEAYNHLIATLREAIKQEVADYLR